MLNPMRAEDNQENDENFAVPQEIANAEQAENAESAEGIAEVEKSAEVSGEQLAGMPDNLPEVSAEALPPMLNRLETLNGAIENYPEAPANYVIRGELLLEAEDYALAAQDFETALSLAQPLAESSNWGYINQALIDRARQGLRQCNQKPKREDL